MHVVLIEQRSDWWIGSANRVAVVDYCVLFMLITHLIIDISTVDYVCECYLSCHISLGKNSPFHSDLTMISDGKHPDDLPPLPPTPTTALDYSRSVSQDLRNLDDALTHAIDQLAKFNSETMSDLSLKYELMRNNEVNSHSLVDCSPSLVVLSESRDRLLRSPADDLASPETARPQRRISQWIFQTRSISLRVEHQQSLRRRNCSSPRSRRVADLPASRWLYNDLHSMIFSTVHPPCGRKSSKMPRPLRASEEISAMLWRHWKIAWVIDLLDKAIPMLSVSFD